MNRLATLAATGVLLFAAGCGSDDDATGGTTTPLGADDARLSAAAAQGVDLVGQAIDQAVTDGTAQTMVAAVRAQAPLRSLLAASNVAATPSFHDIDFGAVSDIDVTIDLDAPGPGGDDRYPLASGLIAISATFTASGTISEDESTGSVAWNPVTVTFASAVSVTDPESGITASWPAGTSHDATIALEWQRTDRDNWSFAIAKTITTVDEMVTLSDGERNVDGLVNADWSGTFGVSADAGRLSIDYSLQGTRAVVWTEGAVSHEVLWDVRSLTTIYVTIDGVTYGPFTADEVRRIFDARATRH